MKKLSMRIWICFHLRHISVYIWYIPSIVHDCYRGKTSFWFRSYNIWDNEHRINADPLFDCNGVMQVIIMWEKS